MKTNCAAFEKGRCCRMLNPELIHNLLLGMMEMADFEKYLITIAKFNAMMNTSSYPERKKKATNKVLHRRKISLLDILNTFVYTLFLIYSTILTLRSLSIKVLIELLTVVPEFSC